ncbi:MAG TPA: hypothetical protein VFV87_12485 [Pirellulaceae bacterium]|nr:hypothetical protein [Pirellulaceae bacterium]
MFRPCFSRVSIVLLATLVPTSLLGQATGPPIRVQTQTVPRQPPPRTPPAGPTAEDLLRMLFPPGSQGDDFAPSGQYVPQPSAQVASPPAPRIPSAAEVASMSSHQQRAELRQALARLDEELDRLPTGAAWKVYLQTSALGSALWSRPESEPEPDADTRDILRDIAERYEQVQKEPSYGAVSRLTGFQLARAILPEYATSQMEKSQRSLRTSLATFSSSLSRLSTAAAWAEHLKTEELQRLASRSKELEPADTEIIRAIAERYDQAQRNPAYRQVTSSAGFAESREFLQQLAEALAKQQSAAVETKRGDVAKARPDASHLERLVVGLLNEQQRLHDHCAEEMRAREALSNHKLARDAPGAGDTLELVRKTQEAEDILRAIKERHEASARAADGKLLKLLKALQAGSTKKVSGQTVMLLPLDASPPDDSEVVMLLQFKDEEPADTEYMLLPLGTDPPKDKSDEESEKDKNQDK